MKDKLHTGKQIKLASKGFAIVDEEFYPSISLYDWHLHKGQWDKVGYAVRQKTINKKAYLLYMHHAVLPKIKGYDTDHKNGNTLDNRKANLRYLTHKQNSQRRAK